LAVARKAWRSGTHRAVASEKTLARFARHARALGITRLADVTGLDYLGVPVFMAVRPNARSLSVAQGKGVDEAAARTSAFMEAAELDHAERIARRPVVASYAALKKRAQVVDPLLLPRLRGASFKVQKKIAWLDGTTLQDETRIFVPLELVDADFTVGRRALSGALLRSTNGLASGNHFLEAVCAGLCEVIERDATFLFSLRGEEEQARRRVGLRSIDDGDCRALIDRLSKRGMRVAVWDMTTDIGVASFMCRISEAPGNNRSRFRSSFGYGCHLARDVALLRAITEAVQSRLTAIVGARDDLKPEDYRVPDTEDLLLALALDVFERAGARRRFRDVPSRMNWDFESDLRDLLSGLHQAGLDRAIVFDLTRARLGIPVVRVIVPGLEVATTAGHCAPGRRARAFARARR
jgi:ribosomal protein S12 methylthiotransferase accessory factor